MTDRAPGAFHLPHRPCRLDAGQPTARRDRHRAVVARAAAAANARRSARCTGPDRRAAERWRSSIDMLAMLMRLWSRGYQPTRSVVVKATSSAGRLAAHCFRPKRRFAGDLSQPARRAVSGDIAGRTEFADRLARTRAGAHAAAAVAHRRAPLAPLHALSIGELTAMSWLAESWSQHEARQPVSGQDDRARFRSIPRQRGAEHRPHPRPFRLARGTPS